MVPFLMLFVGGRLSLQIVSAAVLACAGIGLMSWEGGGNLLGDGLTVAGAFAYAVYVIVLSRLIQHHESRTLVATQIVIMAVVGFAWMLITRASGSALLALVSQARPAWPALVYLGVLASAGMLFLQAVGKRHVSAEKAAVIFAMGPVFAALFGGLWLGETLGVRGLTGGALVVPAVMPGECRFVPRAIAR